MSKHRKRILIIMSLMISLLYLLSACSLQAKHSIVTGDLVVHYLDVGQADSILVTCNGEAMLIDGGNNADGDLVVAYIKDQGINSLSYVIGTHPHEDHIGGLDDVIDNFPIGKVFMPKIQHNTKTFEDVLDAVAARGNLKITTPNADDTFSLGGAEITVLSCLKTDDLNNSSIVLCLDYGDTSFLFTGDAEEEAEEAILHSGADVSCDILKVGHHGSSTSTSDDFLAAVAPQDAIISCGADNKYGHPHKETLKKLKADQVNVWRTDLDGTIVVVSDGTQYSISCRNNSEMEGDRFDTNHY